MRLSFHVRRLEPISSFARQTFRPTPHRPQQAIHPQILVAGSVLGYHKLRDHPRVGITMRDKGIAGEDYRRDHSLHFQFRRPEGRRVRPARRSPAGECKLTAWGITNRTRYHYVRRTVYLKRFKKT